MSKYSVWASLRKVVDLDLRVNVSVGGDLGHQTIAIAGNSRRAMPSEHSVHFGIGFGGLEEADAVVVGVADRLGEGFRPEAALHGLRSCSRCRRRGG